MIKTASLSDNDFWWTVGGKDHKVTLNEKQQQHQDGHLIKYMIAFLE
jgi:hypothetical protein